MTNQTHTCPVCKAPAVSGSSTCSECGFVPHESESTAELGSNRCPNAGCRATNSPGTRLCEQCHTPLPAVKGQVVAGKYRIDRVIATGGFGIVYKGAELARNRPVAIKEMLGADAKELNIRKTFFHREAAILDHLQPLTIIPRLFDYIEGPDHAFIVMEFIPGRNLLDILEQPGQTPFPVATVANWGAMICEVLERMHGHVPSVVHRDLKPENILLLPDGQSIRLIDFGTARTIGHADRERNVSRTKVFTEGYAPPEQVIGKAEPRSDLFALAGTLYQLATGQTPEGVFTGRDLTLRLQMAKCAIAATERWFFELLAINLSENPADRYFSARDFRNDLERQSLTREIECLQCSRRNSAREPIVFGTHCAVVGNGGLL